MKRIQVIVMLLAVLTMIVPAGFCAAAADQAGSSGGQMIAEKININTADSENLTRIPGVGAKTAEKIIRYREDNGGFKQLYDLIEVKGIGAKTFEKMKPYITI